MKIEILTENLENVLPIIGKTIPSGTQLPILSSVLLSASNNVFTIQSTDLEFGVIVTIPAKIIEEGAVAVPGKQLVEVLGTFPKDKILISKEGENLTISGRGNTVSFQTISKEEFPNLFEEKGDKVLSLDVAGLKKIFSKLTFSVSQDAGRPHLTGVLFAPKEDIIEFVSTDGFRLSLKRTKMSVKAIPETNLIVPVRLINEALSIKDDGEIDMYILEKTKQLILESKNTTLVGRLIEGTYPPYSRVIPTDSKTKIELSKDALSQALKTVGVFARDSANVVKMKLNDGKVLLSAVSGEIGQGEAVIDGKQTGDNLEISFNIRFVQDFLKVVEGDSVVISLNSGTEPAVFRVPEDPEFLHVIMPIKVQE